MKKTILLIVLALFMACKQDKTICGEVILLKNTVLLNGKQIKETEKICKGDIIETKIDSGLSIRFLDAAVITIKQNTKLEIIKLKGYDPHTTYINLKQEYGSTFSKIKKNKSDYFISTPTAVINAKGSFELINNKDISEIKTIEGKVILRKHSDKVDVENDYFKFALNKGEKTRVTKYIETPTKMDQEEKDKLKMMAQILPDTKDVSPIVAKNLSKDSATYQLVDAEKNILIKPTLTDLKNIYGNIFKIQLKSGREYICAYKEDKKRLLIFTTNGIFYINANLIEKIIPYN